MENALIIGASGGIGGALADALEARRVSVTALSRSVDGFDVEQPDRADAMLDQITDRYDLIVVALGILAPPGQAPEKSLSAMDHSAMARVFAVNAVGPAIVARHLPRLLQRDTRAVVAVLSARVGSIGDNEIGGWHSYRASKAALNQILRGAAIELKRTHPASICVALHPGTVRTAFTENYAARHKTVSAIKAATDLMHVVDGLLPQQTGGFYDYSGNEVPW
ncbi:short-subunit dehydrogenase [Yoonia maritima]|uniref:Short-subunit dehydrogenase n=1 Tax=Yoonia maritima TaxID=1435347 RepID=A0A2T0VXS2_9RHOB|nr:SDR family NAD(P)-dependent oxidoreductase [Yoonia maritima]PRY76876.1 short-subunit dehydrogenase [Yoonia maritima]